MTGGLSSQESAALAAIDEPYLAALLLRLLSVPSITGSAAESELQHELAGLLAELGLEVDHWPLDLALLAAAPGYPGSEAPRSEAWGLVGITPGGAGAAESTAEGPTLILQGHVDVVPPGDPALWIGDPFTPRVTSGVTGEFVHGRGACDMKAGVVANIGALMAIRAAGIRLRGRIALHLVAGEEDGGLGAFGTLARGHTGDACIITEPTGGTVITANAGAQTFTLRVTGRGAHGSTRDAGVSAVDALLPLLPALRELETRRNRHPDPLMAEYPIPYALSIGTVHAGDWSSTVPDLLVAEGRYGVALDEDPASARAEFEECIAAACRRDPWLREHPAEISWSGGQFASGRLPSPHPLRDLVLGAHSDLTGDRLRERGAPYGSDLRLYAGAGIPTLQLGPGDVRVAHSPREQVAVAEILDVTRTLVVTALRVVGTR